MAVYTNLRVEIPHERVVLERQSNGAPALVKYVLEQHYDRAKGYPVAKRSTIGHQCEDDAAFMHPTTQYATLFPDRWAALTGQRPQETTVRIGLYAAVEAIDARCGIKAVLDDVFVEQSADGLMNAAMEAVRKDIETLKSGRFLTYGSEPWDGVLPEGDVQQFRREWAARCKKAGADEVWLCVDSLAGDWENPGVEILEEGKSEATGNALHLIYAVTPEGLPVFFDLMCGGLEDGEALDKTVGFLVTCGIRVKGVILLRGQCDPSLIRHLQSRDLAYHILLKGETRGCEEAYTSFCAFGKRNAANWIPGTYLFGAKRPVQIFGEGIPQQTLALFWDHHSGDAQITALMGMLGREQERLEQCIRQGKPAVVLDTCSPYLALSEGAVPEVVYRTAEVQRVMDRAGVYSVISSGAMLLREEATLLSGLAASERQYRTAWVDLASDPDLLLESRPVTDRFAVGFLASILRHQIEKAVKAAGRDGEELLQELCGLEAHMNGGRYTYEHTESEETQAFFQFFGAEADQLLETAVQRLNGAPAKRTAPGRKRKPERTAEKVQESAEQAVEHRKRGVTNGTKRGDLNKDGTPRKKPGVQPGTKRGALNKDGTTRKKPGPKGKVLQEDK